VGTSQRTIDRSVGVFVQWFVMVDHVYCKYFERGVADNFESTVWNIAQIEDGRARLEAFGRVAGALDERALQHVARLDAMMEVPAQFCPRRKLQRRADNIHGAVRRESRTLELGSRWGDGIVCRCCDPSAST